MSTFSVRSLYNAHNAVIANGSQRLVRFLAKDGNTYYGDAILPSGVTDIGKITQAKIIHGSPFAAHEVTDQVAVRHPSTSRLEQGD